MGLHYCFIISSKRTYIDSTSDWISRSHNHLKCHDKIHAHNEYKRFGPHLFFMIPMISCFSDYKEVENAIISIFRPMLNIKSPHPNPKIIKALNLKVKPHSYHFARYSKNKNKHSFIPIQWFWESSAFFCLHKLFKSALST